MVMVVVTRVRFVVVVSLLVMVLKNTIMIVNMSL